MWKTAVHNSAARSSHVHATTRRAHDSKLATPQQCETINLHCSPVDTLDLDRVMSLMSDSRKKRLQELLAMTFANMAAKLRERSADPSIPRAAPQHARSTLLKKHADRLVQDNIASRVVNDTGDNESLAFCIPFLIVEQKDSGERLRFICWTQAVNDLLTDVYTSEMSQLQHSSRYVDAVRQECAVIGDLKISFFQVEIPPQFRPLFRFPDCEGNLYEMNRLPMGLRPSAEIMQHIVETITGVPAAVKPSAYVDGEKISLCNKRLSTRVWIDGFQSAGPRAECDEAKARIKKVAKWCNITWKEDVEISEDYDFIGIRFNHRAHQVSVATKTLKKLPKSYSVRDILVTQLEKDISRLFFCSGVLRIIPAHFYFSIKWINRKIAELNRMPDAKGDSFKVGMPPSVATSLNKWLELAKGLLHLPPQQESAAVCAQQDEFDILFTDASKTGWGAFLITSRGEIAIIGGKWSEDVSALHITVLEARGLRLALMNFKQRLLKNKNVDIRVDNTSLEFGLRKGKAKASMQLNEELRAPLTWLVENDFCYSVDYVKSEDNWADGPSRGRIDPQLLRVTRTEVDALNQNRGKYGRQAANSFVK